MEYQSIFWRRLDNPEVMGTEVAQHARELADFFDSLTLICYDNYHTGEFTDYVLSVVNGFQINTGDYDNVIIRQTCDLHSIQLTSYGVNELQSYLHRRWNDTYWYAVEQGLFGATWAKKGKR